MAGVAWPGPGVLGGGDGFGTALPGGFVRLLLLDPTPGGSGAVAAAVGHGVTA